MTRQTWTAIASAVVFIFTAALIVLLPVPYVTWTPGSAHNTLDESKSMIEVTDIATHPTTGQLDLLTVGVTRADSRLSLPEAVLAYFLPKRDALPREAVYPPDKSVDQVEHEEAEMMETAQADSVVAALRAADEPVTERPVVASVTVGGAAHELLKPGDLFLSVDGQAVSQIDQVGALISAHKVGDKVDFVVRRDRVETPVTVTTRASDQDPAAAVVGITVGLGYDYEPRISFDLGEKIGGPSAGMVFSLAIYDKITPGPLLNGTHVAGTGTITSTGEVGGIGGIQEKIAAAEDSGATVFLVPEPNCADLAGVKTSLKLVKVGTLEQGIDAMRLLSEPDGLTRMPSC